MFLLLCACVCVCVCVGVVFGFTNSYFSSLCVFVSVSWGFLCVWYCGFKITSNSFPFFK